MNPRIELKWLVLQPIFTCWPIKRCTLFSLWKSLKIKAFTFCWSTCGLEQQIHEKSVKHTFPSVTNPKVLSQFCRPGERQLNLFLLVLSLVFSPCALSYGHVSWEKAKWIWTICFKKIVWKKSLWRDPFPFSSLVSLVCTFIQFDFVCLSFRVIRCWIKTCVILAHTPFLGEVSRLAWTSLLLVLVPRLASLYKALCPTSVDITFVRPKRLVRSRKVPPCS